MLQEETYFIAESFLNETTHVSFHRRPPSEMVHVHTAVLKTNGHTILHHGSNGIGSHVIHHLTPSNKVRTTTISVDSSKRKGITTKMVDKPAHPEDVKIYGPRK
jgi:hypothetical protein